MEKLEETEPETLLKAGSTGWLSHARGYAIP